MNADPHSENYDFTGVEAKWQEYWDKNNINKTIEDNAFDKAKRFYVLDMFPYPSGDGLHVGHPKGYTASDIITRQMRMKGYNVLHPMGFDSFGLPAENYALKTGIHPSIITEKNITRFKQQIKSIGLSYDWEREVITCRPEYYRWTQWIFLQMYKHGLAYEADVPINWCPSCMTGLANEEVKEGVCERCGEAVKKRKMRQWMLRITKYADRLLDGLEGLDWPDSIKIMQRNWIGRSEGADVDFSVVGLEEKLTVFTTRPDTLFGATYMVLAPEHPFVYKITGPAQSVAVQAYVMDSLNKNEMERTSLAKQKTGVFTGGYAINPVNNEKIPIWIADYIVMSYGTGAIMAVPAHDSRDFEFASRYGLTIKPVVSRDGEISNERMGAAFEEDGIAINSGEYDGLTTKEFKQKIIKWLVDNKRGKAAINYKIRDWVFSRQKFWGEPIPLIHCKKCGIVPVPEDELPLKLPDVERYQTSESGESPLAKIEDWVITKCPKCNSEARRETNTMPQWAGSCWYHLRYTDPHNDKVFADYDKLNYWGSVDYYIGGAEHAVLHLLYARFWNMFLYDQGLVPFEEPYLKLRNQGMVLAEDSRKMSKSFGNVINPDEIIAEHGADTLRLFEMFMGPLDATMPWSTKGIIGLHRFIDRVWRLSFKELTKEAMPTDLKRLLHRTIKHVDKGIESLSFNTAISNMMILVNEVTGRDNLPREFFETFVRLLAPFTPHLCEEIWQKIGNKPSVLKQSWPTYDEAFCQDEEILVVIQVNSKIRAKIMLPPGLSEEKLKEIALEHEQVQSWLKGKRIEKVIAVQGRLINIVLSR